MCFSDKIIIKHQNRNMDTNLAVKALCDGKVLLAQTDAKECECEDALFSVGRGSILLIVSVPTHRDNE